MKIKFQVDGNVYRNRFKEILDGVEYLFLVYWNDSLKTRGFINSGWYIDIYNPDLYDYEKDDNTEALILGGQKLMPNSNILKNFRLEDLPSGDLLCIDTLIGEDRKLNQEVDINTFGENRRYELWYYSEGELSQDFEDFTE